MMLVLVLMIAMNDGYDDVGYIIRNDYFRGDNNGDNYFESDR